MHSPDSLKGLRGFTILEFYTALGIIAILLLIAIPEYNHILMREERELTFERIQTAINIARQEAFLRGKTITICPSELNGSWTHGFMVYEPNFNRSSLDPAQIILRYPSLRFGKLDFKHFGQNLNIAPDGMTSNVGSFIYCPNTGNEKEKEADALIINKAGRTYRPIKRNIMGIYETKEGTTEATPLSCR